VAKQKPEAKPKLSPEEEIEFIKTAPIAKVAAYFGGDLEMAVQLRVDQAVDETYRKLGKTRSDLDITVRPIQPLGNLYGFASVTIGSIKIEDFKIVANKDGALFVGMPSKPDKSSVTGYRNTVTIDKAFQYDFNAAVIREYRAAVEQTHSRANNQRTTRDMQPPPRISDQMARATKDAERANATRPTREKGRAKVARDDR